MRLAFEWDDAKAKANLRKHRVGFEEAITVFDDPFAITFPDEAHSDEEERSITLGMSATSRTLLVVDVERE